jgi:hypothetical protein
MSLLVRLRQGYRRYVGGYQHYLRRRGFGDHLHDWPFFLRGFLACWAQPGFHRFWQVWNPGIGYLTFRLYLAFGGRRQREGATLATFVLNGLVHTVVACPVFRRWSWTLIVAFLLFGILTILSRRFEPALRQERWPAIVNLAVNLGLIILSFDIGFRVNALLC